MTAIRRTFGNRNTSHPYHLDYEMFSYLKFIDTTDVVQSNFVSIKLISRNTLAPAFDGNETIEIESPNYVRSCYIVFDAIDDQNNSETNHRFRYTLEKFAKVYWTLADTRSGFIADPKSGILEKVDSFSTLQPGWGSDTSVPPTPTTISHARCFIDNLPAGIVLPLVSVAEDGEINFFWQSDSAYIDVGIDGDGDINYYVKSESAGIDKDGSEPFLRSSLPKDVLAAIASI